MRSRGDEQLTVQSPLGPGYPNQIRPREKHSSARGDGVTRAEAKNKTGGKYEQWGITEWPCAWRVAAIRCPPAGKGGRRVVQVQQRGQSGLPAGAQLRTGGSGSRA